MMATPNLENLAKLNKLLVQKVLTKETVKIPIFIETVKTEFSLSINQYSDKNTEECPVEIIMQTKTDGKDDYITISNDPFSTMSLSEYFHYGLEISKDESQKLGDLKSIQRTFKYIPEVGIIVMETVFRKCYDKDSAYIKLLDCELTKFLNTYYNVLAMRSVKEPNFYHRPLINQLFLTFDAIFALTPRFNCIVADKGTDDMVIEPLTNISLTNIESLKDVKLLNVPFVSLNAYTGRTFSDNILGIEDSYSQYYNEVDDSGKYVEIVSIPKLVDHFVNKYYGKNTPNSVPFYQRYLQLTKLTKSNRTQNMKELQECNWIADFAFNSCYEDTIGTVNHIRWNLNAVGQVIANYTKSIDEIKTAMKSRYREEMVENLMRNTPQTIQYSRITSNQIKQYLEGSGK